MAAEIEKLRMAIEGGEKRVKRGKLAARLVEKQKQPEEGKSIKSPAPEAPLEGATLTPSKEGLQTDATTATTLPDATKAEVAVPPSALATARMIEDLGLISYPEGITGPKPELNVNSTKGKFL